MTTYVGLTDYPDERKKEHGFPADWRQQHFENDQQARDWQKGLLSKPGYKSGKQGSGWRYGYTFTISSSTKQYKA